jgi:hypothetical protein
MLDEQAKELLKENLELARDNNRMLRKLRRGAMLSTLFSFVYWALLIGLPVYLYYSYIRPYATDVAETYESIKESAQEAGSLKGEVEANMDTMIQWLRTLGGEEVSPPESSE